MKHPLRVKAFAYLEMARPYTLFHAGTLCLAAGLVAAQGHISAGRALLIWLTPTVGWLAGLATSDYHDRQLDRVAKPMRPIPSGRVGEREAFRLMVGLIVAGFVGALLLGWRTFALAWLVMILGVAYARTFKAKGFLGHFDRGLLAGLTVLFGSIAATGGVPSRMWLLVALFFCHDSATNLLGAVRDLEGDRAAGYQTAPVRYGVAVSGAIAGGLMLLWMAIGLAFALSTVWKPLFAVLFAAAVVGDVLALFQMTPANRADGADAGGDARTQRRHAALGAHKVLVIERLILSVAFAATVLSPVKALVLLAVLASTTWWAQLRLRDRYEFAPMKVEEPKGGRGKPPEEKGESRGHAGTSARTA
jgi:4-hydroxybenzoate polyprenyltransferase/geranylgeranylglycerol-phosphate geranylgeranyltransferase